MPYSTMEISQSRLLNIGHMTIYIYTLCIIQSLHCHLPLYRFTLIVLHAASDSCCLPFYRPFQNVWLRSYLWSLHFLHRGGSTAICIVTVSPRAAHQMNCLLVGSIRIRSHLAEVFKVLWFAGVAMERNMMTKEMGSPEEYIVSFKSKRNQ